MEKFKGTLEKIDPNLIINQTKKDEIEDFFLVLGVVFNDLRDMILFQVLLNKIYEKPTTEVNVHNGTYGGVVTYMNKFAAAFINEFLIFLEHNKAVFSSSQFELILRSLPKKKRDVWNDLIDIALSKTPRSSTFTKVLLQIRANITFHFYDAKKVLRKSFIDRFFKQGKAGHNDYACFSIGSNMESTRFYYCDAAVQEYFNTKGQEVETQNLINFNIQLKEVIEDMNETIIALMTQFIDSRKK